LLGENLSYLVGDPAMKENPFKKRITAISNQAESAAEEIAPIMRN